MRDLDLPRGPDREIVHDARDRQYTLWGSETRTLSTVGAFKHAGTLGASFREAFRAELASPLSPIALSELRWYFEQCRPAARDRTTLPSDARFRRIQHAFDAPRYRVLYRRWLEDGDTAMDVVGSGAIAEKLERGAAGLESVVLPHSYRPLPPW
jgi:hypothetical protein